MHVTPEQLGPWLPSMRALESGIWYPIADGADRFTIDHGPTYHPFFSGLGEAHFLLAVEGDRVVGSIAGILRPVVAGAREVLAIYLCDLKLESRLRGQGVARRMLQRGIVEILKHPRGRKARFLYGAAMRGGRGDVMATAQGSNPLRLAATVGALELYFVSGSDLARLSGGPAPLPDAPSLRISPDGTQVVETTGAKDYRLHSTGKPWRLVHWTVAPWEAGWGAGLRALPLAADQTGCFAVDARLAEPRRWLAAAGVAPGARCTVYGLALTGAIGATQRIHIATSEI